MTCTQLARVVMALSALYIGVIPVLSAAQEPPVVQPGTQAAKEDALSQLVKLLKENPELAGQIRALLDKMAKEPGVKPGEKQTPGEPPIPEIKLPGGEAPATQPTGQPAGARAALTPDISVIGNNVGRFFSAKGDPDRNRLQLGEFEIGLQQRIYPGIRFDAFLAAGAEEGFSLTAEEAYATFSRIGHLPLGGLVGKKRLNFGKQNPVHPHARLFADQPPALAFLVGPEALNGNGASVNYTLPTSSLFANLELGLFNTDPAEDGAELGPGPTFYPLGLGARGNTPFARLWLSRGSPTSGEVELGGSAAWGHDENGDRVRLTGVDLTIRKFPGTFKRLIAQGEVFWHSRKDTVGGTGSHTRSGWYALLGYRPDQYFDYGIRLDESSLPWPIPGREKSVSLIWTNRLSEVTLLRLQYKRGSRSTDLLLPAKRGFNELWLQFIWGGGSHTHAIQ
jgi:hypothetical protein